MTTANQCCLYKTNFRTCLETNGRLFLPSTKPGSIPKSFFENLRELTIEAWVKNEGGLESIQAIVSSEELNFAHLQASDNQGVNNVAYVDTGVISFPPIPKSSGQWQHVAISVKSGNSQMYINSVPYGAKNTTTFDHITSPQKPILIGKGFNNGRNFYGKIANIRIWKTARSQPQLYVNQFNFNLTLNNSSSSGLIYYSPTSNPRTIHSVTQAIKVPSEVTKDITSLTIEAWVNQTGAQNDYHAIVSSTGYDFVHFQTSGTNLVQSAIYLDNGNHILFAGLPKLTPGWHHVALVVQSKASKVFHNGIEIGSDSTPFSKIKDSNTVFIGKGAGNGRVFNGDIADVRIWKNRVLTAKELIDHCNTPPSANADRLAYHSNSKTEYCETCPVN